MAFSIIILIWLSDRKPLSQVVRPAQFQDLGSFLLTFVMLWAYLEFSQFLIIWGGNLSEEIPWYLRRMEGVWGNVGLLLVILSFVFPFFLLLFRHVKSRTRSLLIVALLVLMMRLVDMYWMVLAGVRRRKCAPHVDGCGAPVRHGRHLVRIFPLAVAAHADFAGPRSAHGRNGRAGGRTWINHTTLPRPRRATKRATRMPAGYSIFWWPWASCWSSRPWRAGDCSAIFRRTPWIRRLPISLRGHAAIAARAAVAGESPRGLAEISRRAGKVLETYAWENRTAGTVRVPIEEAMELLVKKGLPVQGAPQAQPADAKKPAPEGSKKP